MYENDNNYDVEVEDVMDGMGHPVLTVIASLIGGAAIGTGGTLLVKKLMKDNGNKKLERKQKKLNKLKRDAEKLGIDLGDIPEVEIPTDEEIEIETYVEETEEKPKKGGKKK